MPGFGHRAVATRPGILALTAVSIAVFVLFTAPCRGEVPSLVEPDQTIEIEVHKGRLMRLPSPAAQVFIADSSLADVEVKSPTLLYVFGRKTGESTLYVVNETDRVMASATVRVTHNLSRLRATLEGLVPEARIDISSVDGALVLDGVVTQPEQAATIEEVATGFLGADESLLNLLKVAAPTQVNLRVRVVEVSRELIKEFGFNWDAIGRTGAFLFGLATGDAVTSAGTFLTRQTDANSLFGSFADPKGRITIDMLIDALEEEGLITVLAEPNLTAVSGETASFLAGGEFPIPVPQFGDRITIEFKRFGVSLAFTPTVVNEGRINLLVRPEVSQLTTKGSVTISGFVIPALTTRRAETTVDLASGQSFAVAGLLQNNTNHDISKFPWLGDIPILGTLFRSDKFKREETELVIIVTPYVVRPVSEPARLATPMDNLTHPNDLERILLGRLYTPKPGEPPFPLAGGEDRELRLIGPAGFDLD